MSSLNMSSISTVIPSFRHSLSARKEKETYTVLQVSKFKSAFPTKNSPNLSTLVDTMDLFDIVVVVGLKRNRK